DRERPRVFIERLLNEWSPGRLAYLALLGFEAKSGQAVDGNRGERAEVTLPLGVHEHRTVRGEARRLIEVTVRKHSHTPAREVLDRNPVVATVERDHGELRSVRRQTRSRIVIAVERDALRVLTGTGSDAEDLRAARAIRCEIQGMSV